MKRITKSSGKWTKKDEFNAVMGVPISKLVGSQLTVVAAATGIDIKPDGVETRTAYIVTDEGVVYTGISSTACDQIDSLIDMMDECGGEPVTISVSERNNKQGNRKYLAINLC